MKDRGTLLMWYYHLPSVSSDAEVEDMVEASIHPLLSIHKEAKVPFTLAITGNLLRRIHKFKSTLSLLKELVSNNIAEIAATFFYEIYPPIIPFRYLKFHLQKDIQTKKTLLGVVPVSFYPPNFTWISIFEYLLIDLGIENVVLDSEHYSLSCKAQVWKWHSQTKAPLHSILKDTILNDKELLRIYELSNGNDVDKKGISLFFRNFPIIKNLSFGNTGLFHKVYDWIELKDYFKGLISGLKTNEFITLADDGDRINSVSLQNYSSLLEEFSHYEGHSFVRPTDLSKSNIFNEIPYLPSYSIGSFESFWLSDLDSVHYSNLLNQVYELEKQDKGLNLKNKIMDLQDVYFLFWKTLSRKKAYLERVYWILNNHL